MKSTFSTTGRLLAALCFIAFLPACNNNDDGSTTASISGVIEENNNPAAGVDIFIDGEALAVSDAAGVYQVSGLATGDYIIRPAQEGRTFSPEEQPVTLTAAGLIGINFERLPLAQINHAGATWDLFNASAYSVKVNNLTTLQLDLEQNALWYNESEGGAIYRLVQGDFTLSASVNAVKKSNNAQAVACDVCLGGIMARNPDDAGGENYVHLVTGNTPAGLGYETKNTVNNVSQFTPTEDGQSAHDLRIVREGSSFRLYKKGQGDANWVLLTTHDRPDLPPTLQVGLNIYTAQSGAVADLSVIYTGITLETN